MGNQSPDSAVVANLIEACRRIIQFAEGCHELDFRLNSMAWSAVAFQLIVLGEAVKHRLSQDVCDRYVSVQWKRIKGMRDKLCHRHDSLDPGELWQAALRDVPVLLDQLRVIERDLAGR